MAVGEIATLHIPSEMGYGRRGAPPKIPGCADLEFEIEVVGACCPIEKTCIKESESNVAPKGQGVPSKNQASPHMHPAQVCAWTKVGERVHHPSSVHCS